MAQIVTTLWNGGIDTRVDRSSAIWNTQESLALAESLGPAATDCGRVPNLDSAVAVERAEWGGSRLALGS